LSSLLKGIAATRAPKKYTETELATHFTQLLKVILFFVILSSSSLLTYVCFQVVDTRHAGVLGLAAIAGAHPYDLPPWLPDILVA
jgi:Domain of unknown function (DUF3437)